MTVPFYMIASEQFKREKAANDAYLKAEDDFYKATKNLVYLIFRFDNDDSTLASTFDRGYKKNLAVPTNAAGGLSKNIRLKPDSMEPANLQEGGHAEEIFIRSLQKLAREYGAPQKIEVFTSLIPCMFVGAHGSNAFLIGNGQVMPEGCGAKLNLLVDMYPTVSWAFAYEKDYYAQGGKIHHATTKEMLVLDGKPNASVYRYLSSSKTVKQITVQH